MTSTLHPTLTKTISFNKITVSGCSIVTFAPNPATAGSATYNIPALASTAMPAAETITIPDYDQKDVFGAACSPLFTETFTYEVNGVANDLSAYANWFTVSGKTVTLVVSEGNRAAVNSQRLTVTVVNTLTNGSVNKGYTFTVTALRAECDSPTTITYTAITFTDPFITVLTGASSTGTFNDAGYTLSANTASEVCGPRTYVI